MCVISPVSFNVSITCRDYDDFTVRRGNYMNLMRTILDGTLMCVIFNAVVGLFWFIVPQAYSVMFPAEIKKAAAPYVKKKDLRIMNLVIYPLYILMIAYMVFSAVLSGVTGFWNLFWTGYIEMFFVNVGDFLILDCWLRSVVKDKGLIKGAENSKAWEFKEWMMKLAVPEHALAWPLIFCPLVGFICAGIGMLIG